jgi:hypothetical protein
MLLPLLGHRINKMQVYLWISTDANYFMLSLVKVGSKKGLSIKTLTCFLSLREDQSERFSNSSCLKQRKIIPKLVLVKTGIAKN